MQPTIGRTLIYKLSMNDAARINAQLVGFSGSSFATKCGNPTSAGAEFPLVVTRVLPTEGEPGILGVNGQVLFDGNGTLWVTYVHEGTVPGTWHWPVRARCARRNVFEHYLELEKKLAVLRTANGDDDSPEEDALLDVMEKVWYQLTEAERRWLDAPGGLRDGLMRARI